MDLLESAHMASQDYFAQAHWNDNRKSVDVRLILVGRRSGKNWTSDLKNILALWQIEKLKQSNGTCDFLNEQERISVLSLDDGKKVYSSIGCARDGVGQWRRNLASSHKEKKQIENIQVEFLSCSDDEILGSILGLGLAEYKFLNVLKNRNSQIRWSFRSFKGKIPQNSVNQAKAIFRAMNLARHLSNAPAEIANADAMAKLVQHLFKKQAGLKIKIFNHEQLIKENAGLLVGVAQGSKHGARLVHLRYRPSGAKQKPLSFVGKGVIFDTGGLDIKNSSGMRLMKKDMSGTATLIGLAQFIFDMKLKVPCDFYLPFAENSISENSMRPGDILKARNGLWVEIDNTDAEGRLVMADAFDFAVEDEKEKPSVLVDVSTLTGAMRVAVGLDCAGFFSTDEKWASKVKKASEQAGELSWQMPLIEKYSAQLNSHYADLKNSSESGYGGAITAALFLQRFTKDIPWIHFDVMSWNLSASGAISEGANAQTLQILAQLVMNHK